MTLYIQLTLIILFCLAAILALLAYQQGRTRALWLNSGAALATLLSALFFWQQYHGDWQADPHWQDYYRNFNGPSLKPAQAASKIDHPEILSLAEQTRQARQRMNELKAVASGKIGGENFDTFQLLLAQGRLSTDDLLPLYQRGGLNENQILAFMDQGLLSPEQWLELEEKIKQAAKTSAPVASPSARPASPAAPSSTNSSPAGLQPLAPLSGNSAETVALALATQAKQLSRAQLDQLVLAQLQKVSDQQIQALLPDLTPETGREQLTVIITSKLVSFSRNELAARFLYEFYRLPAAEQKQLLQQPLTSLPPQQQVQLLQKPLALLVSDTLAGLQKLLTAN